MTDISEALVNRKRQMATANEQGIDLISEFAEITFTQYRRVVLPLDGFVFWVRSDLTTASSSVVGQAIPNAFTLNDNPPSTPTAPVTMQVQGSLHYETTGRQEEDETYDSNRVILSAEQEVAALNVSDPDTMWLGTFENIRFSFTSRSSFFEQAGLWHYVGDAVYADMSPQIVDNLNQIINRQIVSNSLPIWLSMNNFGQEWAEIGVPLLTNVLPLYPSYLSPLNLTPPFATIHVEPGETTGLAAAPLLGRDYTHSQLSEDTVRVTLWGCDNIAAADFLDFVNQFSLGFQLIGITNIPIIRDEKRPQTELTAIAQKKIIDFRVNYYQFAARNVAREYIKKAIPTYIVNPN